MFKMILRKFRDAKDKAALHSIIRQLEPMPRPETVPITIPLCQQALRLVNRDSDPKLWAQLQRELGIRLHTLTQGDRKQHLEDAIAALKAALTVRTREAMPAAWARTRSNLANAYMDRLAGNLEENIEHAIEGFRKVLNVRTKEKHPNEWAGTQMDLATAYMSRIKGQKADNQEHAIESYQNALEVWKQANRAFDCATIQFNLGNAYRQRLKGRPSDNIEEAIQRFQEALNAEAPQYGPMAHEFKYLQAEIKSNMAGCYLHREAGAPAENIEFAIELMHSVLKAITRGETPELWAEMKVKLALAYLERIRGTRAENTELAISNLQSALEIWTLDVYPREWVRVQKSLSTAFLSRAVGDRSENIEAAIHCLQGALEVVERLNEDTELADLYVNLGNVLMDRILGTRSQNIERAIEAYLAARKLTSKEQEPREWSTLHNNLATAYEERIQGDPLENWNLGLQACDEALAACSRQNQPQDWARAQNNRGVLLMNHPKNIKEEILEEAIQAFRWVLEIRTRDTRPFRWALTMENLAIAYKKREYRDRAENLQLAAEACKSALRVLTPDTNPESHLKLSLRLASILLEQEQWQESIALLEEATVTWEHLYKTAMTDEARRSLQARFPGVGDRLPYALARSGRQANFRKAVVLLERGRARMVSEKLALDTVDSRRWSEAENNAFIAARDKIAALRSEARHLEGADAHQQYLEISQSLREAHATLDGTLASSSNPRPGDDSIWQDIRHAASICPLVYILPSQEGGAALIVSRDGSIRAIPLGGLRWNLAFEKVVEFYFLVRQPEEFDAVIERTLRWLWDEVLGGVYVLLAQEQDIVLITGGLLSQLPLHAAWRPDAEGHAKFALDHWTVRYAPNAKAVIAAHRKEYSSDKILAVEASATMDSPLTNASFEVGNAMRHFDHDGSRTLRRDHATAETLLKLMPEFDVMHSCCHAEANPAKPLHSALIMAGDEPLSLQQFLDLSLPNLRLVVLSSCEMAVSELSNHDEMLGFPVGLMQAGAGGVVASLWPCWDESTAILMTVFYDNWKRKRTSPAQALAAAQRWMRDTPCGEMLSYFELLATEDRDDAQRPDWEPVLEMLREPDPEHRLFSAPFYWAGFSYTGI